MTDAATRNYQATAHLRLEPNSRLVVDAELATAQARIAELEAAMRKIEHSAKWCKPFAFIREGSLGFIEGVARRALEAKP